MVAVFRTVGLGILLLSVVLHLVGFVTHYWVSAKLDLRGLAGILSANGMGSSPSPNQVGMSINMGLWEFCIKSNMGGMGQGQDMNQDGQSMPDGQSDSTDEQFGSNLGLDSESEPHDDHATSSSMKLSMCQKPDSKDIPGELHVLGSARCKFMKTVIQCVESQIKQYQTHSIPSY